MNLWSKGMTHLFLKGKSFLYHIAKKCANSGLHFLLGKNLQKLRKRFVWGQVASSINIFKKYIGLIFICVLGIFFMSSAFLSCAPGFDDPGSQNPNDPDDDDDDDDDDDEGRRSGDCEAGGDDDTCKDDESCVRVCESIYVDHAEVTECKSRSERQVGRMDKIHNLLLEKFSSVSELESNLESISEEDGDVSKEDFICYLEISGDKWIDAMKDGLGKKLPDPGSARDAEQANRLIAVLKWFVEKLEITEILREDIDDGDDILEALLVELEGIISTSTSCITDVVSFVFSNVGTEDRELWSIRSGNVLNILHFSLSPPPPTLSGGEITFDTSKDKNIYNALSCHSIDDRYNVFSYSAFKNNEVMFEMAFELLTKVCDVKAKPRGQEDKACARAMMCWTAWQNANGGSKDKTSSTKSPSDTANGEFWDMAEKHKSELDGDKTRYNNCSAEHFTEFFVSD